MHTTPLKGYPMIPPTIHTHGRNALEVRLPSGVYFFSYNTLVAYQFPDGRGLKIEHKFSQTTSRHLSKMCCGHFESVPCEVFAVAVGYHGNPRDLLLKRA